MQEAQVVMEVAAEFAEVEPAVVDVVVVAAALVVELVAAVAAAVEPAADGLAAVAEAAGAVDVPPSVDQ